MGQIILGEINPIFKLGNDDISIALGEEHLYPNDYSQDYFTMVVTTGGDIVWSGSTTANTLSYSKDNGTTWTTANSTDTISVNADDKVLWKGTPTPQSEGGIGIFSGATTVRYSVEGNAMSLLYGDDFRVQTSLEGKDGAFSYLFSGNTNVTSAENLSLPATTLVNYCYQYMFSGCKSLTTAPSVLPATTLASSCYGGMFWGCTSLTTAPELPATTLASSCYYSMFRGCTSLTTAPELPATTLAYGCYQYMFNGCTGLTTAPVLPSTTLAQSCYQNMFNGCSSLTTAPKLPATTLAYGCYQYMFNGCTGLTSAPQLPATTLVDYCYQSMFKGCTGLTSAPALPATTLAHNCYNSMFDNCKSLTSAPKLPATTLVSSCYLFMFFGCSSLNYIECQAKDINASNCTLNWVSGVAASGTFVKNKNANWSTGASGIPNGWTVENYDSNTIYLTFTATQSGTFKFSGNSINYSLNYGKTWTALASDTDSPAVLAGSKIMWRATLTPTTNVGIGTFSSTANFTAEGNPMSLLYGDNFTGQTDLTGKNHAFRSLFSGCTTLISAENVSLPATTLTTSCYADMFRGCTNLTTAPTLPATTLADYCYRYMFNGCTNLTTAPTLPATTLASYCYQAMFSKCSSLRTAPALPATTLAQGCYNGMFLNCSSLRTAPTLPATTLAQGCYTQMFQSCTNLTTAPALPATTLAQSCYFYMFNGCTNLATAPALPATTLAQSCYNGMFSGCTRLNSITCLATDISATNCINNWVYGVASTGIFRKDPSMTGWTTGVNGIPSGWSVQDFAPASKRKIRMWIDDFGFESTLDEVGQAAGFNDWSEYVEGYVQNPEAFGGNGYDYTGESFVWEGDEYFLLEMTVCGGGISENVLYLITDNVDYAQLSALSLEADDTNEYCPYVAKLNDDYEVYAEPEPSKKEWLVKVEDLGPIVDHLRLWFDDYPYENYGYANKDEWAQEEFGYNSWDDYMEDIVADPEPSLANGYDLIGTFVWEGEEYYLWEMSFSKSEMVYYMLTDTASYSELYALSMENDPDNENCPYVALLTDDYEVSYETTDSDWLIKVEQL